MVAAGELTENISILGDLAPSNLDELPEAQCEALRNYGKVKFGLVENVRVTAKGYELFAIWMNALYDFAEHTGQLFVPDPP